MALQHSLPLDICSETTKNLWPSHTPYLRYLLRDNKELGALQHSLPPDTRSETTKNLWPFHPSYLQIPAPRQQRTCSHQATVRRTGRSLVSLGNWSSSPGPGCLLTWWWYPEKKIRAQGSLHASHHNGGLACVQLLRMMNTMCMHKWLQDVTRLTWIHSFFLF